MNQLSLLEDSLDWVKSKHLALFVSAVPLFSAIFEVFFSAFRLYDIDTKYFFLSLFWLGSTVVPRVALLVVFWQALALGNETGDTDEVSRELRLDSAVRAFRWRAFAWWVCSSVALSLLLFAVGGGVGAFLFITTSIGQAVFGLIIVWVYGNLFLRILELREDVSHDAKPRLLFSMLQWLFYMELFSGVFYFLSFRMSSVPWFLLLASIGISGLLLWTEPKRAAQLRALGRGELSGLRVVPRKEVTLDSSLQFYPIVSGLQSDGKEGVLVRVEAPSGGPFRGEQEIQTPVALCPVDIEAARAVVQGRLGSAWLFFLGNLAVLIFLYQWGDTYLHY